MNTNPTAISRLSQFIATALLLATAAIAQAQVPRSDHTFGLEAGEARPRASLEDATWLAGNWVGTGFGKSFEEVWNPPSAGSMVGFFKLFNDSGVAFYEILLLLEVEGSLSLKVKHFNADFTAWEEKAEHVDFRLVKLEPDALHFGGISFYRRGPDRIDAYLLMREGEDLTEYELKYQRRGD